MNTTFKIRELAKYLLVTIVFALVSLIYFKPVLSGKKIFQSDIAQFRGMSKELKDFREQNGKEAFWTDAAFGGMPSYQLSTYYPHNYIKVIDSAFRFLPRPADYLFLYFVGFFVLLSVLRFDWKLALIGSLAFGFSTYFIIILGVGHNAKAHAIGYMPMVVAGVLLLLQKRYLLGFVLTSLAMGLEVQTSHPQMTYYLLFFLLFLGIFYAINSFKKKTLKTLIKPFAFIVVSLLIGVLMNSSSLLATKEYASQSTRSKSVLTITPDGKEKVSTSGLSKDYITEYSYGILETFNLLIPRLTGGANNENLGQESHTFSFLRSKIGVAQAKGFSKNVPTYWGNQPIVAAPAYIGAVFVFLFFVGCFLLKGWLKKALIAITIFSILMSWGKNFSLLTDLFISYMPLYNKFRAVSSIQVIAEISIPLLGMLALKDLLDSTVEKTNKLEALKKAGMLVGGILIFFTVLGGMFFSFEGLNDGYYNNMIPGFSGALAADRKDLLFNDGLRSIILVLIVGGILWASIQQKVKQNIAILIIGTVLLFDMIGTAHRYVNDTSFLPANKVEKPFQLSAIDKEILQDKGHYRVANFAGSFMNDGATSYYHKSIGGYHAAKLGRYQELVDFHIVNNNIEVLNMLNTKYFIIPNEEEGKQVHVNLEANGNAWFIKGVKYVDNANDEILALDNFNSKEEIVINKTDFGVVNNSDIDSEATIKLSSYKANELTYVSNSKSNQIAVFSEIYYQPGWNAYIDGKLTSHFRANYVLRAIEVPGGKHNIVFKFEPTVIATGGLLSLVGYLLLFLIAFAIYKFNNKQA
ncbi:YfhO family protein [Flavobacteriaceae bacterium]|nr:YfhO family protein [Flavobacteriaceae bacterium]